MKTHNFTIIASGAELDADDLANRLFEAGCDDSTVSLQKGAIAIEFDRDARNFVNAVCSAISDVQKAGLSIQRIEPDFLVSASEIAVRAGIGRAAVSLYAAGERGERFPRPVARVTTPSPLWNWVEVASWLHHQKKLPLSEVVTAKLICELNAVFWGMGTRHGQLTRLNPHKTDKQRVYA